MRIKYTLPASGDLENILDYLESKSLQGFRSVGWRIKAIEKLLVQFPLSGSLTRLSWLRKIVVTPYPYLIFYEIKGDEIIVHAVRYSSRRSSSMPDA